MTLTADYLRSILRYEVETGFFYWLDRRDVQKHVNSRLAGKRAGYVGTGGYISIIVDKQSYAAHRLAWLYVNGKWPDPQRVIDHVDRNPANNAFTNLRLATAAENRLNRLVSSASGRRGVTWHRKIGRWQAQIEHAGKVTYLGCFDDKEEAARAYQQAAADIYGGEFAGTLPQEVQP
jgi:hypothetical protein